MEKKKITVFGGDQLRPNLNINDMIRAYKLFLEAPKAKIHGKVFNVGYENRSVKDIANMVHKEIGDPNIKIVFEPTKDHRSYHINSDKVARELNFKPQFTIQQAIRSLVDASKSKKFTEPLTNPFYHNIKRMNEIGVDSLLENAS